MSISSKLREYLASFVPTKTRVIVKGHQQPTASAHTMDVDLLHAFLRMAESGDCTQLFGLYRDIISGHAHTQSEFSKRKLAVLGDPMILTSIDPADAASVSLDAAVQAHLVDRPGWVQWLSHNLDSTLYPVSLSARSWKISARAGWRYEVGDLTPVPHSHLAWPYGVFSTKDTDDRGYFLGTFSEPARRTHIIHTGHLLTSVPDWWGGPMRALVFWWLFATMDRDWWTRFLDRFGSPFLVGKYPEADDAARWSLQDAFSSAVKLFGLAISSETDVQLHQANTQGGSEAFERFHAVANREISKLIVGQTSSSEIQNSGLGGGQGAAQAEVREDIRRYDALALGHTIRTQILSPLWRLNGWTSPVPNVSFGSIGADEADLTGDLVASLYSAGIELSDDGLQKLSSRLGLGLRRTARVAGSPISLSALPSFPLLPSVARRAARQRQARGAVDSLVAGAAPKVARLMRDRSLDIAAILENADSPEAAGLAVPHLPLPMILALLPTLLRACSPALRAVP